MSTTVIINPKTGLGYENNPYDLPECRFGDAFCEWVAMNPALPVITTAGEALTEGRYECEKVWRLKDHKNNVWFDAHADTVDFFGNDLSKQEELFPGAHQVWKVIETPELPGKETVEEAAEKYNLLLNDHTEYNAFIAGANWQKEKSIDRDKVIAEIEKNIIYYSDTYEHVNEVLIDLLQVIKQL